MIPSSNPPSYRVGVEVELLLPSGLSRRDLAERVATKIDGSVTVDWHVDSEPSAHKQLEVFHHLTPRFVVTNVEAATVATFASDITIRSGLDPKAPPQDGWTRILSDDLRLLRILGNLVGPGENDVEAISEALRPLGLSCEKKPKAIRVVDDEDTSIALIASMPGETERITECISPPLEKDPSEWLDLVIGTATEMGATCPSEGATHVHYDADVFAKPDVFQRLVWVFGENHEAIRDQFETNPNCRRLGPLPAGLVDLVDSPGYEALSWEQIKQKTTALGTVTKYADVNLLHLISDRPRLDTVEFRMLPPSNNPAELREMIQSVNVLVRNLSHPQPVL